MAITTPLDFLPMADHRDHVCGICRDSNDDSPWIAHEVATSQTDQKVQHAFHKDCLWDWLVEPMGDRSCPLCRRLVNIYSLIPEEERGQFISKLNHAGVEFAEGINIAYFYNCLISTVVTCSVISITNYIQNAAGYNFTGFWTTLAMGKIASTISTIVYPLPYFDKHGSAHAEYVGAFLSVLNHIDPLSWKSINVLQGYSKNISIIFYSLLIMRYSPTILPYGRIKYVPVVHVDSSPAFRHEYISITQPVAGVATILYAVYCAYRFYSGL